MFDFLPIFNQVDMKNKIKTKNHADQCTFGPLDDLDRHSGAVFNERFWKIGLILQLSVREDKLLPIIPDAELDGFGRESEERGVDTHVFLYMCTWRKKIYIKFFLLFVGFFNLLFGRQ